MADNQANEINLLKEVEEGPYYKAGSPQENEIADANTSGQRLILTGRVLDEHGSPVVNAWLDFWQADGNGMYDNAGYRLRGHQYTGENGEFRVETVMPGRYGNRVPHVHVKVKAWNSRVYTTQLFFTNDKSNSSDPLFEPANVMKFSETPEGKQARFDIVIRIERNT